MSQMREVATIVLNYNGGTILLDCLRALLSGTTVPRIYLVDNASTDDSLVQARKYFPEVAIIKNPANVGFAAGMNVGIRQALSDGAEYVWLMNNDAVVETTTLEKLLAVAREHPEQGLWSPAIYSLDGETPWFVGGDISYFFMRTTHRTEPRKEKGIFSSEFLTGCALLLSRSVTEHCGPLDERYFLYYEDAAYSLTARRAGFSPTVVPTSRVRHAERSEWNREKIYWLVRSGASFFLEESPWYWQPWIHFYLLLRRFKNTLTLIFFPTPVAREVKQAYTDAFRESHG